MNDGFMDGVLPRAVLRSGALAVPVILLALLGMMTLPVPPILLDLLFTFNIALSLVVLLVAVYTLRPLEFAIFPTVLLVATLLRLALNVASTRVVLLNGHEGGGAAGQVIESFGEVVIGGNYVVGFVVFMILVIINFVVVTKGAGRVSEVSARFTLDAMPGKQMAIDADLNAGIIDQEQAKQRRVDVAREADFYGAMDGASKFVRGDAMAGILILVINVVGGLVVGTLQHDLSFGQAAENYVLLTIGDGLAAQIPSLLLSTAAAVMVTRVNSEEEMGEQVRLQMFEDARVLMVAAGVLLVLGAIPGMPHGVFLGLGTLLGLAAWWLVRRGEVTPDAAAGAAALPAGGSPVAPRGPAGTAPGLVAQSEPMTGGRDDAGDVGGEVGWNDVSPVDPLGLEVGYRLIPMVDRNQGGELLARIRGVRRKLSQELGFLVPTVHIRDNLNLAPDRYRISVLGVTVAEDVIYPGKRMALNPGDVLGPIDGIPGKDPAFGLEAVWIDPAQAEQAQANGYTVVDPSAVLATHLNQIILDHCAELFGHDEVQKLLDVLGRISPRLAEELVPGAVAPHVLMQVLKALLAEQVPLTDIRTIAETVLSRAANFRDPAALAEEVRRELGPLIVQTIFGEDTREALEFITIDPDLESVLLQSIGADGLGAIEPTLAERLLTAAETAAEQQEIKGKPAVLLAQSHLRRVLARLLRTSRHPLHVLAFQEIPETRRITVVNVLGGAASPGRG